MQLAVGSAYGSYGSWLRRELFVLFALGSACNLRPTGSSRWLLISRSMSSIVAMLRIWLPGQHRSANLNAYTRVLAVLLLICTDVSHCTVVQARSTTGIKPQLASPLSGPTFFGICSHRLIGGTHPSPESLARQTEIANHGLQRVWSAQTASPCTLQHITQMTLSWELGSFRSQPLCGVAPRNCMWSHGRKTQP